MTNANTITKLEQDIKMFMTAKASADNDYKMINAVKMYKRAGGKKSLGEISMTISQY